MSRVIRRQGAILLSIAASLASTFAAAATYSNGSSGANFDVSMKIVANCSVAANPLDFGQAQGVLSSAVTANSAINVTCSNTTPFNVGLSAGTGTGSTGTTRYLSGTAANTATVQYHLFQAPGATAWGDSQGSNTLGGTGTGAAQTLTVYGQVPAQATPAPDTYKSTITATVYF